MLVVNGYRAVAAKATGHPTVIAAGVGDPLATGPVDGLGRPGGNVTGIADVAAELSTKRLGLLHELIPVGARCSARDYRTVTSRSSASFTPLP